VTTFPSTQAIAAFSSARGISAKTSDDELIKAIARGDRHAMKLLYTRHSVKVFRFAKRFLADESQADDVVSDVFLDVWRKAGAFAGRSQVSTWLLAIARYRAIGISRRRSFEPLNEEASESIADEADTPEAAAERNQTNSLLAQCLTKLSPIHREVIDLVYYHGRSIEEVADIISVPANTVKTRMFYARNHLAKLLAEVQIGRDALAA
jgi:RNA polymerase sigma-70 factor (ECF subfamily)